MKQEGESQSPPELPVMFPQLFETDPVEAFNNGYELHLELELFRVRQHLRECQRIQRKVNKKKCELEREKAMLLRDLSLTRLAKKTTTRP